MDKANQHIIRRQIFDFQFTLGESAKGFQNEWSTYYQDKVLPKLAVLFDELAPPDEIIRLERLEIDLGGIRLNNLEARLFEEIEKRLRLAPGSTLHANNQVIHRLPKSKEIAELFFYFLSQGILPWWATTKKIPDLEVAVLEVLPEWEQQQFDPIRQIIESIFEFIEQEEKPDILVESILKTVNAPKSLVFKRLIAQFSDAFIEKIIVHLWRLSAAKVKVEREVIAKKIEGLVFESSFKKRITKWVVLLSLFQPKRKGNPLQVKKNDSLQQSNKNPKPPESIENVENTLDVDLPKGTRKRTPKQKTLELIEGYSIENAGLVLIAPYLLPFFRAVGLVEAKEFKSEQRKHRGVHLLQYLVGYEEAMPEYFMILNKILCQIPFEEPIQRDLQLTDAEKKEAQTLLQSIIQNWGALKKTSIEGLQETFLQRNGKLWYEEETKQWKLKIESKTVDVLLNHLPWTYSILKLPWMPEMLKVDW